MRRRDTLRPALPFVLGAALSCASPGGGAHETAATKVDGAAASASTTASAAPVAAPGASMWVGLVREERWTAAAAAIDALPEADRKKPEVRFARARVAMEKDDGKTAVAELADLEVKLPALAPEIARARARAQAIDGPYADAGEWLAKHAATNDNHVAAAGAFMKAKLPARASAECARVIGADHKTRAQETAARSIRMHAFAAPGGAGAASTRTSRETADAVADARWLLVHGTVTDARDAESVLAKEDPKHLLAQRDWVARARALADDAKLDDALRALNRAQSMAGPLHPVELRRARADAMMRARARYMDAAFIFGSARTTSPTPRRPRICSRRGARSRGRTTTTRRSRATPRSSRGFAKGPRPPPRPSTRRGSSCSTGGGTRRRRASTSTRASSRAARSTTRRCTSARSRISRRGAT